MAIKDRKEREKQDMKNLIIESATQLFLKQGYDKTSIRSIAEDIEYSPATIYLYFKDKDEIFYEIHENAFALLTAEFRQHDHIADPYDRLCSIARTYIRFAMDNPDYYDLMFIMRAPLAQCKDDWRAGTGSFSILLEVISECVDQKKIKPVDKFIQSMSVWSMGHGLVSLYVRDRFKIMHMPEDVVRDLLDKTISHFLEELKA